MLCSVSCSVCSHQLFPSLKNAENIEVEIRLLKRLCFRRWALLGLGGSSKANCIFYIKLSPLYSLLTDCLNSLIYSDSPILILRYQLTTTKVFNNSVSCCIPTYYVTQTFDKLKPSSFWVFFIFIQFIN